MGSIFLIQDGGQLAEMTETPYESEDLLQTLLAKYPSLLAGDQFDPTTPRQWLLISREIPLASELGGVGRWSIDHVFIDQDAIPTLVEVKRASDTRIRREVVGQMLDYAANAVVYWPVSAMQEQFERRCLSVERESLDVFAESLDLRGDIEDTWELFWAKAKVNLEAGRIRMVFLADIIPPELRRIVEFLNGQMDPAQVLAVEVKQYIGQGQRAMVPRVVGQAEKPGRVSRSPTRPWDEAAFFAELASMNGAEIVQAVRTIFEWLTAPELNREWAKAGTLDRFRPIFSVRGHNFQPIGLTIEGRIEVLFGKLESLPPFDDIAKRRELWVKLNEIDGVSIGEDRLSGRPSFPVASLTDADSMQRFLDTLEWLFQQVQSAYSGFHHH